MAYDSLTIPLSTIKSAISQLPQSRRGAMALALLGIDEGEVPEAMALDEDSEFWSYALTLDQARTLVRRQDALTREMLRHAVMNERDGVAIIDWSDVKRITGVTNWSQFARGRLGGIHRSLATIPGVPSKARLLWEGEGWVEDGQGDFAAGTLAIDGPAVQALKTVLNLPQDAE